MRNQPPVIATIMRHLRPVIATIMRHLRPHAVMANEVKPSIMLTQP